MMHPELIEKSIKNELVKVLNQLQQLVVGVHMNVPLKGTDCLQKSLDGIFFSSCLCIMYNV